MFIIALIQTWIHIFTWNEKHYNIRTRGILRRKREESEELRKKGRGDENGKTVKEGKRRMGEFEKRRMGVDFRRGVNE